MRTITTEYVNIRLLERPDALVRTEKSLRSFFGIAFSLMSRDLRFDRKEAEVFHVFTVQVASFENLNCSSSTHLDFQEDTNMFNHTDGKEIVYKKIGPNRNLVTLATAYDHNCSEQETCEVSDEVLELMLNEEKKNNRIGRKERRSRQKMPKNDQKAAELGLSLPSAEDVFIAEEDYKNDSSCIEESKISELFASLTDVQRRRLYFMFKYDLTYEELADREGISYISAHESIDSALRKLKNHGAFLLTTSLDGWLYLLK